MKLAFSKKAVFYFAPLLLWGLLIFMLSSIPGSANQSYDLGTFVERKGAHISEYFILVILWVRVLNMYFKNNYKRVYRLAILASLVFAVSDEFHQTFVFGRSGKITDVMIDFFGILLGIGACYLFRKKKK